jgi:hypothetical protein
METQVEITKDYYTIKIPTQVVYENKSIKRFIDFLRIKIITSRSQATDDDIKELSNYVNESFWKENRDRLLNEIDS